MTSSRPASLAVPDLDCVNRSSEILDVANGLHHIIKVRRGGVGNRLSLPESEGVDKPERVSPDISYSSDSRWSTHRMSTPPVTKASAVPSWNLFQLSAVPTLRPVTP